MAKRGKGREGDRSARHKRDRTRSPQDDYRHRQGHSAPPMSSPHLAAADGGSTKAPAPPVGTSAGSNPQSATLTPPTTPSTKLCWHLADDDVGARALTPFCDPRTLNRGWFAATGSGSAEHCRQPPNTHASSLITAAAASFPSARGSNTSSTTENSPIVPPLQSQHDADAETSSALPSELPAGRESSNLHSHTTAAAVANASSPPPKLPKSTTVMTTLQEDGASERGVSNPRDRHGVTNGSEVPNASAPHAQSTTPQKDAKRDQIPSASSVQHDSEAPGAGTSTGDDVELGALRRLRQEDGDFRDAIRSGLAGARRSLFSAAFFSIILNLLILAIPIYLFQISDRVLTSRSMETLAMLTIVVVGALAFYAILDVIRRTILMRMAASVESVLSGPVLKAATKAAQLGSTREFQLLGDIQQIRNFMTGPVLLAMLDAPIAPVYFLAVYLIHPQLGVILTTAALLLVVAALVNQRLTGMHFSRASAFHTRANHHAEALSRSAQAVNAMGMIREGTWLWGREMAESLKSQACAQDRNVVMTGISKFLRLLTQVMMLCWGAYLTIQGELTGGTMIAASIIASRALAPVEGLIEGWRGFVQARSGYARINGLLATTPLVTDRLLLPRPTGRLRVERVLYVPPPTKRIILNGIDFALEPGESLAIVGPSGTGKSTLARMLVGSIHPTSGSVRLDLMDIRNWDPRQLGESVGYLPQDVELFPGTVKLNIARLREDAPDELIFDAAELAGINTMVAEFPHGYETQIAIDGSPLSGGQRQRIGLARAFFGNPRLVVLDEPNSNLDSAGELALSEALRRAKARGTTVVAVTQRPQLLRSVDKIMLLSEGRIQAFGPRDELLPSMSGARRGKTIEAAE